MSAKFELDGKTAIITMLDTASRNVLSPLLVASIMEAFDLAEEKKARVVIFRSEPSSGIWSAGYEISAIPQTGHDPLDWNEPLRQLNRRLVNCAAPVIAMIEGDVWGGACELVMNCDIVVTTPDAGFTMTPARLGVPYDWTGIQAFMNVVGIHIVKEMMFTAKRIGAERAWNLGIVNHIVESNKISDFCMAMARNIEKLAPLAIALMKEEMNMLANAKSIPVGMFEENQGKRRNLINGSDYHEGLSAFKERRSPVFTGE